MYNQFFIQIFIIAVHCQLTCKKKYHTVGTVPKPIKIIVERDNVDNPNTQTSFMGLE